MRTFIGGAVLGLASGALWTLLLTRTPDVRAFFAKARIGTSTDFGLVKHGNDHFATFHGLGNDREGCEMAAETFNRDAGERIFSCVPLNR